MEAVEYNSQAIKAYNEGRFKDAEVLFKKAIEAKPNYGEAYANLGALYAKFKLFDKAIDLYKEAIRQKPRYAGAYTNMGNALNKTKRYEEAVYFHKNAIALDPSQANHFSNCASAYKNLGRFNLACRYYEKALELDPEHINAHFDLATVLLQTGEYEQGWQHYEWRYKKEEMVGHVAKYKTIFDAPRLSQETPQGSRVLVHAEQGYGDVLMVARYLQALKDRGMVVVLYVRSGLEQLFLWGMECVDEVYEREKVSPQDIEFDCQIPFMSLPLFFDPHLHHVADHVPYIHIKDSFGIVSEKYKIGVVWGASNTGESYANKVFDIRHFGILSNDERFALFSLQVGEDAHDIARYNMNMEDLSGKIENFYTTATIINDMDIVITSDTSVAHLAGAMGKEVWVVLQKVPDWRWGVCGEKSVWYPSARLFFQDSIGDFNSAFKKVYKALQARFGVDFEEIK